MHQGCYVIWIENKQRTRSLSHTLIQAAKLAEKLWIKKDIINRGGGNLIVHLYNADENEEFADTDVTVTIDGKKMVIPAGGTIKLRPGQSITLLPRQYHRCIW